MSQRGLNEAIAAVQRMRLRADPVQLAEDIQTVGRMKSREKSDQNLREAVETSVRLGRHNKRGK